MTLSAFLTLAGLQALIAISPGPAGVLTIKTAAAEGTRSGLLLSFGLALAILVWAAGAMAGLSLLFEVAPYLQTAFRLIGAAFLIWIGISLWRKASEPMPEISAAIVKSPIALIRLGLLTNLANPKALAYFAAVFTGIMPTDPTITDAALILAMIFATEFAWYAILSLVFSRPTPRRAYARAKGWLDRAFGGIVTLLGAKIATT